MASHAAALRRRVDMATLYHQVWIGAPAAKVYEAIATPEGVGTWWDKQSLSEADGCPVLEHDPGPEHGVVKLKVLARVPHQRIEWECLSTHPATSPASAWTGTRFRFDISERANRASISGMKADRVA